MKFIRNLLEFSTVMILTVGVLTAMNGGIGSTGNMRCGGRMSVGISVACCDVTIYGYMGYTGFGGRMSVGFTIGFGNFTGFGGGNFTGLRADTSVNATAATTATKTNRETARRVIVLQYRDTRRSPLYVAGQSRPHREGSSLRHCVRIAWSSGIRRLTTIVQLIG